MTPKSRVPKEFRAAVNKGILEVEQAGSVVYYGPSSGVFSAKSLGGVASNKRPARMKSSGPSKASPSIAGDPNARLTKKRSAEVDRVLDELRAAVEHALDKGADPGDLVGVLTASLPSIFDEYGPFYDTEGVTRRLGLDEKDLSTQVANHQMLAVETSDGHLLYPVWQFDDSTRQVPAGLQAVLSVLLPAVQTPWTAAAWLRTPSDIYGGIEAIDAIRAGESDAVLNEARHDAAMWSY